MKRRRNITRSARGHSSQQPRNSSSYEEQSSPSVQHGAMSTSQDTRSQTSNRSGITNLQGTGPSTLQGTETPYGQEPGIPMPQGTWPSTSQGIRNPYFKGAMKPHSTRARNTYFTGYRNLHIRGTRNPPPFIGARNPPPFIGARNPPPFIGARNPPPFIGARNPYFTRPRTPHFPRNWNHHFTDDRALHFTGARNPYPTGPRPQHFTGYNEPPFQRRQEPPFHRDQESLFYMGQEPPLQRRQESLFHKVQGPPFHGAQRTPNSKESGTPISQELGIPILQGPGPSSSQGTGSHTLKRSRIPNSQGTGTPTSQERRVPISHVTGPCTSQGTGTYTPKEPGTPYSNVPGTSTSWEPRVNISHATRPSTLQEQKLPSSKDISQGTKTSITHGTGTPISQKPVGPGVKREETLTFLLTRTIDLGLPLLKEIYNHVAGPRKPGESLEALILRITGMSEDEFGVKFNPEIRDLLNNDPSMDSFDMIALFTLLQHGCTSLAPANDRAWLSSGTLEYNLKCIKDIRNNIIHSDFSISEAEFYNQLEKQRTLLVDTALLAQLKFSLDEVIVKGMISKFHSRINDIRDLPFETNYFALLEITPLIHSLKSKGIPELKEALRESSIVNPASLITGRNLPMEVAEIFTPLIIVDERGGNTDEAVCLDDVLAYANGKKKDIIILEGIAGIGKTTIIKKIISDWFKGGGDDTMKEVSDYDFIIPMQCRERYFRSVGRIASALMPAARKIFREDKHMTTCLIACKTFFILDGLDEVTDDSEYVLKELLDIEKEESMRRERQRVEEEKKKKEKEEKKKKEKEEKERQKKEAEEKEKKEGKEEGKIEEKVNKEEKEEGKIEGKEEKENKEEKEGEKEKIGEKEKKEEKPKFMLLMTTRPEKIREIYQLIPSDHSNVLHLRIDGVAKDHRDDFITKYHTKLKDLGVSTQCDDSGLLSYLQTTGARLQDQWTLPLNLTLVTLLWGIDDARILSITCPIELLIAIRDISRVRLEERVVHKIGFTLEVFDKKIKAFFSLLAEIALMGIRDSDLLIPENKIQRLEQMCATSNLPSEELFGALLAQKNSWAPAAVFTFPTKSGQEYYAAIHIYDRVFGTKPGEQKSDEKLMRINAFLSRHGVSCVTSLGVTELMNEEKAKGNTITEVLAKVNQEVANPPSMDKYQNTLTSLLGILHYNKGTPEQTSADEMVKLLKEAGVKERRDWITVLNKVKCDSIVANTIIRMIPNIFGEQDDQNIKDLYKEEVECRLVTIVESNVFAYATLLEHEKPKRVQMGIKGNPSEIPRLNELCSHLARGNIPIWELSLDYLFRHPNKRFKRCLNTLLDKCPIQGEYTGSIPSGSGEHPGVVALEGLRDTRHLWVPLFDGEDAEHLFSFLHWRGTRKSHDGNLTPLSFIGINIGKEVTPSHIPRNISTSDVKDAILIFLSDVEDTKDDEERMVGILQSINRELYSLSFPRYQKNSPTSPVSASVGGGEGAAIKRLLSALGAGGIRATDFVVFPSRCRPSVDQERKELEEEAKRILGIRGFFWGSPRKELKSTPLDLDSWE